jgi:thioredoxin 2
VVLKADTEAMPNLGPVQHLSRTLALFVGGREVARQAGAMSASDIVRWAVPVPHLIYRC